MNAPLDIVVRYTCGAYTTRCRSQAASSTMSAQAAADRLGRKLLGNAYRSAQELPRQPGDDHNVTRWRLVGGSAECTWPKCTCLPADRCTVPAHQDAAAADGRAGCVQVEIVPSGAGSDFTVRGASR